MSEPLDPQKYHIMSEPMKKKLIIAGIVFVFVILPLLVIQYYKVAINRPSALDRELSFEIKSGEGVSEISRNLYKDGAVNSEFLFALYVFFNKLDRSLQAGVYTVKAGTSVAGLAEQFQHGENDSKITFIEGWRVEEFARAASMQFEKIDYAEFVRKASPYEGFLFPDTYYFEKDIREDEIIARLRQTFDMKSQDLLKPENLSKVGLTKEQVVTLASIVEREVNKDDDRRLVAGILLNRFKVGMSLGADATTQYAVAQTHLCGEDNMAISMCARPLEEIEQFNWWPNNLTQADLEFDSPYNTRKHLGIPPGPIANPSLSAIEAVINYENSEYSYYLNDSHGNTHFAKTLDEHNANIREFLE